MKRIADSVWGHVRLSMVHIILHTRKKLIAISTALVAISVGSVFVIILIGLLSPSLDDYHNYMFWLCVIFYIIGGSGACVLMDAE